MSTPTTGTSRPAAKKTASTPKPETAAPKVPGKAGPKDLSAQIQVLTEGDLMSPQGVYDFMEALRAVSTTLAFHVHAASSQLEAAARKGARDNADGLLTLAQTVDLHRTLRRMSREMNARCAEDLLACAKSSVRTYALLENFLENLETDSVSRPHRTGRGGFSLYGGN